MIHNAQNRAQKTTYMHRLRYSPLWGYVLVATVALMFRTLTLGVFVSGDEMDFWLPRSHQFLAALQRGDAAATAISTHPGVTTMWLGSAGIVLRRWLFDTGLLHDESFATLLAIYRLPTALVHSAGVVVGYALLQRLPLLMKPQTTLFAALLWATDPFVIAFDRVLHVDGLASTFLMLSVLAACVYWLAEARWRWLILSGACAGLAMASKSPAVLVVPIVAATAFFVAYRTSQQPSTIPSVLQSIRVVLPQLLVWGTIAIATIALVWPAIWVNPMRVYTLYRVGVEVEGGSPHMMGNFFLGHHMEDPGWLFYPVSLILRMTPWTLIGVLFLPYTLLIPHVAQSDTKSFTKSYLISTLFISILALLVVVFIVGLSVFPKKFNRYLVVPFPAVDILAAIAIYYGGYGIIHRLSKVKDSVSEKNTTRNTTRMASLIAGIAIVNAAWYHPYAIAYYNQLCGGATAGPRTVVVGWGEGYEQVAQWLNEQPDITNVVTLSKWGSSLNAYLRSGAQANGADNGTLPDATGYIVVYIRHVLGGINPTPPFDRFYRFATPLHVVNIHGVNYAWIYRAPPPPAVQHHTHVAFGTDHAIQLSGYSIDKSDTPLPQNVSSTAMLTLTVQWHAHAPITANYMLFVQVFDANGTRIAQIDVPPASPAAPTSTWHVGNYAAWVHPIPLPSHSNTTTTTTTLSQSYTVAVGLYDPSTFTRLPIDKTTVPNAYHTAHALPDAGNDALFLEP